MDDTELGSLYGSQATGPRTAELPRLTRGEVIGRYVVVEKLGAGGMGVVYSAYDPELDRRVALKLLNPRGGGSKASRGRARLIREAQALAKLNHTNVVTVHDVGEHEGRVFLAMEYVEGVTLGTWIAKGPHPWHEVIEVLTAAGRGLTAAHDIDMTHRDFKPDNVMLTGAGLTRRVVVMDFGLATAPSTPEESTDVESAASSSLAASVDLDSLTRTGAVMGTPAYMAPEQHTGTADQHADQFSFCVTLYEALYDARPFAGTTVPELLAAAIYGDVRPAPPGSTVPQWVREAVLRGLEADASDRWPTIAALIDALHDNPSRRRWLAAGAVGIVLTAAAVYGVGVIQDQRSRASCAQEAARLDELWGAPQREQLAGAFAESPLPYAGDAWERTESRLDEEVESWSSLRMSTCLSRTSLDPDLRDTQDACFEARRRRVENAVTVLSEPDAALIQRAVRLADIETQPCADDHWLRTAPPLPDDHAARLRQQELRQDLDLGRALHRAGRFEDATAQQETVVEAATAAGELHLAAVARFEFGNNLLEIGRLAEGAQALEDAYFGGRELSFDTVAGKAARRLVAAHGKYLADPKTGRMWARHAQLLTDPQQQPTEQANLDLQRALLEFTAGDQAEAIELNERALAVFESNYGSYGVETLAAKESLLAAYDRARRTDDSLLLAREVLQARTEVLGPLHPRTLSAHSNLSAVLIATGEFEEAETHARTSLATGTEPDLVAALGMENLSLILERTGRADEALEINQSVVEIRREQLPPRHVHLAHTLVNRSLMLFNAGRLDEVTPLVDEAVEIYLEQGGPQSPYLVSTYRLNGAVQDSAGNHDAAIASFSSAAETQARVLGPKHSGTVAVRVEVAQAVLGQGDYLRAIELCEPWIEAAKRRDDFDANVLFPLHFVYGRGHLIAGSPELAKRSLSMALELATKNSAYEYAVPVMEIDLGRLRWKITPDKAAAIADVEAALAKLKARDDADLAEVKRAETWLAQTKPKR